MSFLNLSLGQFLTLFAAAGGIAFVLYLLDRSRRKVVVPTLRFWTAAEQPTTVVRRKTVSQPWSLVLQLIGILLLLLAIAQLRFGVFSGKPRDHIVLLDTSAWMNAAAPAAGNQPRRSLMDMARRQAALYVRALPGSDRVMLIRADALATPATPFLADKFTVLRAIADSKPASTALDLGQALSFAARTEQLSANRAGEIVYVGPARIADSEEKMPAAPNLRVLAVMDNVGNSGIRHVGLRRSPDDANVWDVYVSCRNYGRVPRMATIAIGFGGAPAGAQQVTLEPNADHELSFKLRTHAAGLMEVRLSPSDDFADDNRAVLEIPAYGGLGVTIYSDSPDLLRPLFGANSRINAVFKPTAQYRADTGGLVVLDHFRPAASPYGDALWLDPPPTGSPIPVRTRVDHPEAIRWATDQVMAAGLRTKDARPDAATVFEPAPGDLKVAEIDKGPVIIARNDGKRKMVVVGFHPSNPGLRYELATPLLIGNILRWLAPESFRNVDLSASSVGTVNAVLEPDTAPDSVRVVRQDGQALPFSLNGQSLHFFSGTPGIVRVEAGSHESVYSLSLPGMWTRKWEPPASVRKGLPAFRETLQNPRDLWQTLAALGALAFVLEWILFGRMNRLVRRPAAAVSNGLRKAS
ncbi:MAG TPA: BatA and WFA domain-containing protein [Bryobacteraceae bacterium]|jgi:hypothetical protein